MRAAEPRASFLTTNTGDVWSYLFRLWKTPSFCFSPVLEWTLQSSCSPCNTASLRNAHSEERKLLRRRWRYDRLWTKRRKVAPIALTLRASSKLPINQHGRCWELWKVILKTFKSITTLTCGGTRLDCPWVIVLGTNVRTADRPQTWWPSRACTAWAKKAGDV